ncbi:xaa-Pro dipeptidase-like [Gossypium australe]|uniref:Xaa-Pro dipeptidase-like n=1 Tax=Gossypium australe TaxID=47621 RepID=A0A5B6X9T0_9ROSI|nr:xaa-Pro dipeptidase-like [Gossypium australe]
MVLHFSNRQNLLNSLRRHLSDFSWPLRGFAFLQGLPNHSFLIGYLLIMLIGWGNKATVLFPDKYAIDVVVFIMPGKVYGYRLLVSMTFYIDEIAQILTETLVVPLTQA